MALIITAILVSAVIVWVWAECRNKSLCNESLLVLLLWGTEMNKRANIFDDLEDKRRRHGSKDPNQTAE